MKYANFAFLNVECPFWTFVLILLLLDQQLHTCWLSSQLVEEYKLSMYAQQCEMMQVAASQLLLRLLSSGMAALDKKMDDYTWPQNPGLAICQQSDTEN